MLARHLAATEPFGAGWFLDASDREALIASLAEADLAAIGRTSQGRDLPDREAWAQAALQRLAASTHRWVVVLDNADGEPGPLLQYVPRPQERCGQLVLITTTRTDWEGQRRGVRERQLRPLRDDEIEVGDAALRALVQGRPLLSRAFSKLLAAVEPNEQIRAALRRSGDGEMAGPTALWGCARASGEIGEQELRLATVAALLPPGHQPLTVLERCVPGARESVIRLAGLGLLDHDRLTGIVRMHRLIGAAIRADVRRRDPELLTAIALRLLAEPGASAVIERSGTLATAEALRAPVAAADAAAREPDEAVGCALHELARLIELRGDAEASAQVYRAARRHLAGRPLLHADCLLGEARLVNHRYSDDQPQVEQALEWAATAQALVEQHDEPDAAGRYVAMQGLLVQKLTRFPDYAADRAALLERARGLIRDAHERRVRYLPDDDPELYRSHFNFGGIGIRSAQDDRSQAVEHLDGASAAYRIALDGRREIYRVDTHPHISACWSGLALANYYRAVLVPATPAERSAWLRDASKQAQEALRQREQIDGPVDSAEVSKIAERLTKIALARYAPPRKPAEQAREELVTTALGELRDAPPTL